MTNKKVRVINIIKDIKEEPEVDPNLATAYYAGGSFWGVEYYFQKLESVISTSVGFMGGEAKKNPNYCSVFSGRTSFIQTTKVLYNPELISYEELTKYFFEIHDPTQLNQQGPDLGEQYRSVIFYSSIEEKKTAQKLIATLKASGFDVVTKLEPVQPYFEAEGYHQDYYLKQGKLPYSHTYRQRF